MSATVSSCRKWQYLKQSPPSLHKVGETLSWRRGWSRPLTSAFFTGCIIYSSALNVMGVLPSGLVTRCWYLVGQLTSPLRLTLFISPILRQTVLFLSGGGHHLGVCGSSLHTCSFVIFASGRWQPVWSAHYPQVTVLECYPFLPCFFNITYFKLKPYSPLPSLAHLLHTCLALP